MLIVTSIYCAKLERALERAQDALTGKGSERNISNLKDANRDLISVYQGTNRATPMDRNR